MNYKLPNYWNFELAQKTAKKEGGKLVLSAEHYPVITKDIWVDAVVNRKRSSKWIIYSDAVPGTLVFDRLQDVERYFFVDSDEYKLSVIAFGNGCRFVEIKPLETLCPKEEK